MEDADVTERATPPEEAQTPPTKRLRGFVAASQKTTAHVNKPVSLVPVEGRPGYFKLVDLPDLFPVLPASAATLLRDVTVEEAVAILVGKEIPWAIQAALGASGYVTVEDLADRWNTPAAARDPGPGIPGWGEWVQRPDLGLHGDAPPSGSSGGSQLGPGRQPS